MRRSPYLLAMAIREIIEAPDPRLKTVSEPVAHFDDDLRALVDDMFETMYDAHGIGLAAIQVGEPVRLLVIDLQEPDPDAEPEECHAHDGEPHTHQPVKHDPRVFVNPEIIDPSGDFNTYQEGCLSVPDIYADVDRPKACRVRWQDLDGKVHEEAMEGAVGHLHSARDGPSQRRAVHRPSLPPQAQHGAQEAGKGPQGCLNPGEPDPRTRLIPPDLVPQSRSRARPAIQAPAAASPAATPALRQRWRLATVNRLKCRPCWRPSSAPLSPWGW